MTASEYKDMVGLYQSTALINEKVRSTLISKGIEQRKKNLSNNKGRKVSEATKQKIRKTLTNQKMENKNQRGTCPEQLIDRLKREYLKKDSHFRTKDLSNGFYEALVRTYGSYKEACRIAEIPYREPGMTVASELRKKGEREKLLDFFSRFIKEKGRNPSLSDFRRKLLPDRNEYKKHFGGWRKALKLI